MNLRAAPLSGEAEHFGAGSEFAD